MTEQQRKRQTKQNSALSSTCTKQKSGKKTLLPPVANMLSEGSARLSFDLLHYSHKQGGTKVRPRSRSLPTRLKRARCSRSFSFVFSPRLSPLLLQPVHGERKEKPCCCDSFARAPPWKCDNNEGRELRDFELAQHASLISWQRRSIAM